MSPVITLIKDAAGWIQIGTMSVPVLPRGSIQPARPGPPPAVMAPVLVLAAIGLVVVIPLILLAAIPMVLSIGLVVGGLLLLGVSIWAGIEGLAALERWLERDPRFRR